LGEEGIKPEESGVVRKVRTEKRSDLHIVLRARVKEKNKDEDRLSARSKPSLIKDGKRRRGT